MKSLALLFGISIAPILPGNAVLAAPVDLSTLQLNGDASIGGSNLVLTPDEGSQIGSAFMASAYSVGSGITFSASFGFDISTTGSLPADGLTFVVQSDPRGSTAIGEGATNMGYSGGLSGIRNSIAVAFDTYSVQHGAVRQNGNLTNVAENYAIGPSFFAGPRSVWVDYDGALLSVYYGVEGDPKPGTPLLTYLFDLTSLGSEVYFGFTAGTGGGRSAHVITGFDLDVAAIPLPIPLPAPALLVLSGMMALAGVRTAWGRRAAGGSAA